MRPEKFQIVIKIIKFFFGDYFSIHHVKIDNERRTQETGIFMHSKRLTVLENQTYVIKLLDCRSSDIPDARTPHSAFTVVGQEQSLIAVPKPDELRALMRNAPSALITGKETCGHNSAPLAMPNGHAVCIRDFY